MSRPGSRSTILRLSILASALAGCTSLSDPTQQLEWIRAPANGFTLEVTELDRERIEFFLDSGTQGRSEVQEFFGLSFLLDYVIRLFPNRASLSAYWQDIWRAQGLDGCSIAAARQREVTFLSPGSWKADGCGQNPAQSGHVQAILTHELVHVLHEQWNPALGRVAEVMPWFVEGLAVFASGQLRFEYQTAVRELVASGQSPTTLADIWASGSRYGLAGSVVAYIDQLIGRAALTNLLSATTNSQVLAAVGLSEPDLLAGWRAAVLAGP
jgi:hypothetical protein